MDWENAEGIVFPIVLCLAFCVGVKGCTDYNTAWEQQRGAARIEAIKSQRSANAIACVLNSDSIACERAEKEGE